LATSAKRSKVGRLSNYIFPKDVNWIETKVLKMEVLPLPDGEWRYKIWLPDWLAIWDAFADWETKRFLSMEEHLTKKDILFDIGAEVGWCSVIYAKFVGLKNMVLVEPASDVWPNMKYTWKKNYPMPPLACYFGLFSDKTTSEFVLPKYAWPAETEGEMTDKITYRSIHEHGEGMPQMKIDDYARLTGIKPTALTIDVEGAELLVLQGAEQTLREGNLKVWVSLHPELMLRDYNCLTKTLHDFMLSLGYKEEHLATDHEEHWYFSK
jgi:FkbM family methyltransferase